MAKAKIIYKEAPKPIKEVILTLTRQEAIVLRRISGCIAGMPSGNRGLMDNIYHALVAFDADSFKVRVNNDYNLAILGEERV